LIDRPIDDAISTFEYSVSEVESHLTFIDLIGKFVGHIYKVSPHFQISLSPSQARAKAISILEEGYDNGKKRGYDAALVEALNPNLETLESILSQMVSTIKIRRRSEYKRFVIASRIDSKEWPLKCLMAETLLSYWEPEAIPIYLQRPIPQLAH
jgi:hypothetical protein